MVPGSFGVERYTDVVHTQVEASKEESEIRSISKKSETERIFEWHILTKYFAGRRKAVDVFYSIHKAAISMLKNWF